MPRKTGSIAKKDCWKCQVLLGNQVLLNQDFKTLNGIATKLGLTYAQISELTPNGRKKKRLFNSPYITDILISKIKIMDDIEEEICKNPNDNEDI